MTIIRPNKNQKKFYNIILFSLGLLVIALILSGIGIYGIVVGLRHDINLMQKNIQETELTSVKLQNQVYSITNISNLEKKAAENGLVKEPSPEYLNLKTVAKPQNAEQVSLSL